MNWYKKAQQESILKQYPHYGYIGHHEYKGREGFEAPIGKVILWVAYANGTNFQMAELKGEQDVYDHSGLFYDADMNFDRGILQGRYDESKNIVSVNHDPSIFSTPYLPNRLINRLKKEFGQNVKILDYSKGSPEVVI